MNLQTSSKTKEKQYLKIETSELTSSVKTQNIDTPPHLRLRAAALTGNAPHHGRERRRRGGHAPRAKESFSTARISSGFPGL